MPTYLHTLQIERPTGVIRDAIVNTWHTTGSDDAETQHENIGTGIEAFFTQTAGNPGSNAIASYYARNLAPNPTLTTYLASGPAPHPPLVKSALTIPFGSYSVASSLPAEVALVMSLQSGPKAGSIPIASRRGRVYLGPFSTAALGATNSQDIPSPGLIGAIQNLGETLVTLPASGTNICIWSPKLQIASVVDRGWVDNAWDTQRRRGSSASQRYPFPS